MEHVEHPKHYNLGRFEVIDVINDWKLNFQRGNAIKYLARAGRKSKDTEIQDLKKAIFYIEDEIRRLEEAEAEA
jgi:hypothetical protein